MYVYKGAEFWKDAALTYLRKNVLHIDKDVKNNKSSWWPSLSTSSSISILTSGTLIIGSVIALLYMKKKFIR